MTYEHPDTYEVRHEATVTTGDIGARCVCLCGWSKTAPKATECLRAYRTHVRKSVQREGAQS